MKLGNFPFTGDDRGVSPALGMVFVIAFVVLVGLGLFLFGQGLITGDEDPRIDASFSIEAEDPNTIELYYDTGDEFTSSNTDELYVIGENSSGQDIGPVMLYNGSAVVESGESELNTGTLVLSADRANDNNIDPGSSLKVVWEPEGHDDLQIVVDEVVVPDEATIIQNTDQDGAITGQANVSTGGCQPQEGDSC